MTRAVRRAAHLCVRFFSSLWPAPPSGADLAWADSVLTAAERRVWVGLSRADRREGIRVARGTQRRLATTTDGGDPRWLAAALLHDAGKAGVRLGPFGRSAATVAGMVAAPERVDRWATGAGWRGEAGRYLRHAERGAEALRAAGARPEVVAWAGVHHRPDLWPATRIPAEVSAALAAADGEVPR